MRLTSVGTVIAMRKLRLGKRGKVTVVVGKPKKFRGESDYYCPYRIVGIGDEIVRHAGGVDPIQALQLAFRQIDARLSTSKEAKIGKLTWDAGSEKGDFGFL